MFWLFSVLLSIFASPQPAGDDDEASRTASEIRANDAETQKHRQSHKQGTCMSLGWLSRWMARVLRLGVVPRHIAFILDGNRRFAVKHQMERKHGHSWGFDKLHEALEWCFDAGVEAVSVYAFSIENFKRPPDEVETLMRLAKDKFEYLLTKSLLMKRNKVVIRVWGDLALLSNELRELVNRVMEETRGNSGPALNVCFPYTSSHELLQAVQTAARDGSGQNASLLDFEKHLFSRGNHPQLLVRTSGETRLSDFFCWQTGHSIFVVCDCLWPEFSVLHFAWTVLCYRFAIREESSKNR